MRESFAIVWAGLQSLVHNEIRETPVDRLGALAYASMESELGSLGVDLLAYKGGGRLASKPAAEAKLANVLGWTNLKLDLTAGECFKVARHAIVEWMKEACTKCRGRREVPDYDGDPTVGVQRMKCCPKCEGSGLRRWTDTERREELNGDYNRALLTASRYIGTAVKVAEQRGIHMLRDGGLTSLK